MKVNFEILEYYTLIFEGKHIDLHNNFDFISFTYDIQKREIKLTFKQTIGDWVDKNEFTSLTLTHKAVSFLRIIEQDVNSIIKDDMCMAEVTFFPSTAREINDSILLQPLPNEGDDILYFFENGQLIRINCEEILLHVFS